MRVDKKGATNTKGKKSKNHFGRIGPGQAKQSNSQATETPVQKNKNKKVASGLFAFFVAVRFFVDQLLFILLRGRSNVEGVKSEESAMLTTTMTTTTTLD